LDPRRDQIGAKLVEEQKADHEHDEAAEIEDDDAAGQRRRETGSKETPSEPHASAKPLASAA
jgi:hypothetical protein